jgi:putative integral membrane protein (TIGR02587 family)
MPAAPTQRADQTGPWRRERDDLLHGVAGAFLFGAPLLYTMEVWWTGTVMAPARLLLALALTYLALLVLDVVAGFRAERALTLGRALTDSTEALALGLLCAAASLLLLRRVTPDGGLDAALGQIVLEGVPFSIGVGIANGLFRRGQSRTADDTGDQSGAEQAPEQGTRSTGDHSLRGTVADAGATVLGATIVALAIAPTEEVPMLAASLTGPWLLALIGASLALSYVIVFQAEFGSRDARRAHRGLLQSPLGETVGSYLLALLTAASLLWFFRLVQAGDPPEQWLSYVLVLGLPASIGGAAGRLAV